MPFSIVRNNIADMHTDAIVNTANPRAVIGAGADTAIHDKAGPKLLEARKKIGDIPRGGAAITPAFGLSAKYVIHTVGPIWRGGTRGEAEVLRSCYAKSLALADVYDCKSIAFPLISAGNYGFPKDLALQTAIGAISEFLMKSEMMVYLVVFDETSYQLSEKLFADVKSYIDENLVGEVREQEYRCETSRRYDCFSMESRRFSLEEELTDFLWEEDDWLVPSAPAAPSVSSAQSARAEKKQRRLEDILINLGESFPEALARMINQRGLKNSDVYNRANITRQHFSKILNKKGYQPSKEAVLALAIALQLNLDEAKDFLGKAGFALSRSSVQDVIVQYFIETANYDMFELEAVLYKFTEKTLANY